MSEAFTVEKDTRATKVSGGAVYDPQDSKSPSVSQSGTFSQLPLAKKLLYIASALLSLPTLVLGVIGLFSPVFLTSLRGEISQEKISLALENNPMSFDFQRMDGFGWFLSGIALAAIAVSLGLFMVIHVFKLTGSWSSFLSGLLAGATSFGLVGGVMCALASLSVPGPEQQAEAIASRSVMGSYQNGENWVFYKDESNRDEKMTYEYSEKLEHLGGDNYRYTFGVPDEVYQARVKQRKSLHQEEPVYKLEEEVKP